MTGRGTILTLNAGSSSLRFALFEAGRAGRAIARGGVECLDTAPHLLAHDATGAVLAERRWPAAAPFAEVLTTLLEVAEAHLGEDALEAVGHRIVHGGADHIAPALVTADLLALLETLMPLDPLHMPHNLAPIHAIAAVRPSLPQVVCFDTGFHHTVPAVSQRFALPPALEAAGVRRYGFHGLSYEYIAGELATRAPDLARGRVVVAHLGAGASLCAIQQGRSIATTMGFSALDGLMMGTRCGNLDPGVILYLGRQGRSFAEIEKMLYHESGLLGVSGISSDMRVLLESDDPRAQEAIALFVYRILREMGAMASVLGGLDGLVFTAGIGQHVPPIRAAICVGLAWLGVELDSAANAAGAGLISAPGSRVQVHVVATDEEAMIARHTQETLRQSPK
ncbi:acetate/propionate family kinase [Paeniroseomonas aquatica]|uniref:Acetate kinase n=1 Tax=Paeniroseomonas aquatica TaxID=373043 RepID=A0ABT8A389_9PROT|nr:acetate/propionate family kinase [Paeniroseomonas aquatica]MDN3564138.1 acetate/propionate family kinase [Paeniroseomonas aquatica]